MVNSVTVKVPATTANLGPGFDCLGMALDIWNSVRVDIGPPGIVIHGEDSDDLRPLESNLVFRCFRIPFVESGRPVPEAMLTCQNEIPLGRGLGSSSAATVAGLMAGNELAGRPLSPEKLLARAARIEGHPDNVAPALLGGCQIVVSEDGRLVTSRVPVPRELKAVLFVPDIPMPTSQARALLPDSIDRKDAVYNLGRVSLLVRALATGDLTDLAIATEDRLHQPARQAIFPPMKVIMRAALDAGALGVFLSGAGPSLLAVSRGKEMTIGYEMVEAASKAGVAGAVRITRPTDEGAHFADAELRT